MSEILNPSTVAALIEQFEFAYESWARSDYEHRPCSFPMGFHLRRMSSTAVVDGPSTESSETAGWRKKSKEILTFLGAAGDEWCYSTYSINYVIEKVIDPASIMKGLIIHEDGFNPHDFWVEINNLRLRAGAGPLPDFPEPLEPDFTDPVNVLAAIDRVCAIGSYLCHTGDLIELRDSEGKAAYARHIACREKLRHQLEPCVAICFRSGQRLGIKGIHILVDYLASRIDDLEDGSYGLILDALGKLKAMAKIEIMAVAKPIDRPAPVVSQIHQELIEKYDEAVAGLEDKHKDILATLRTLGAFDFESRKSLGEIAREIIGMDYPDSSPYKRSGAELSKRRLVETKKNSDGGYWLTFLGAFVAERLNR